MIPVLSSARARNLPPEMSNYPLSKPLTYDCPNAWPANRVSHKLTAFHMDKERKNGDALLLPLLGLGGRLLVLLAERVRSRFERYAAGSIGL